MNCLLYPASIDWELTSVCNHNCVHCYNYWRGLNLKQNKDTSIEKIMSIAKCIVKSHPVSVQITGGEPLVVWEKAKGAIQLLIDNGINVSINTNATLVNDEIAEFFYKNNMDAFVSFPCCDSEVFDNIVNCKGAAKRTENGIQILLRHKVRVSLNMVVTKINYPYVYDTAMYVKQKFNVPYFSATKASFPQNAIESFRSQMLTHDEFNSMLDTLLKVKKETGMRVDSAWVYSMCGFDNQEILREFGFNRKCGCGRYNFVVDSNGNMKACGCDSKMYGNILEDSFENAISRMNDWRNGSLLPVECKKCGNLKYCGGGCRLDAYSTTGNRCGMDSTANLLNKGRFISGVQKQSIYRDSFSIALNSRNTVVQENGGVRLSIGKNYAFITNQFYDYLLTNQYISIGQLHEITSIDKKELTKEIKLLLKKGILIETKKSSPMPKDISSFSILFQPYLDNENSVVSKDYLCDLSVRHVDKA